MAYRKRGHPRSADLDTSSRVPQNQLGHVLISGVTYPLIFLGDWTATDPTLGAGNPVSYHKGNVVASGGFNYVALATNTNDEPPSGSWDPFNKTQYFLNANRVWTKFPVGSLFTTGGNLIEAYFTPRRLLAWYRMGDFVWPTLADGYTDDGYRYQTSANRHVPDSSVNHNDGRAHFSIYREDPNINWVLPIQDSPGALAPSAADEGYSLFRMPLSGHISGSNNDYVNCVTVPAAVSENFENGTGTTEGSVAFWMRWPGYDNVNNYSMPVLSNYYRDFGGTNDGGHGFSVRLSSRDGVLNINSHWSTSYASSSGYANFEWTNGYSFSPNTWYHIVYTYQQIASNSWRKVIYINTVVVFDGTSNWAPSRGGQPLIIGAGYQNDLNRGNFVGGIDEVAFWGSMLTQGEVNLIYAANRVGDGDTFTPVTIGSGAGGTVGGIGSTLPGGSGNAPLGEFLESDGSGGTTWAYPALHIYHNGA